MRTIFSIRWMWAIAALLVLGAGVSLIKLSVAADTTASAVTQPTTVPAVVSCGRIPGDEQDEASQKTRQAMEKKVDKLQADKLTLEKTLKYIADKAGVSTDIHWKALESAGVDLNNPVTVNLSGVTWSKALTTVLMEGSPTANLDWIIDEGVVTISVKEELQSQKYQGTRIYDLSSMLYDDDVGFLSLGRERDDLSSDIAKRKMNYGRNTTENVQAVIDMIESNVAWNTWRANGGTIGWITASSQHLIVNQTAENHKAIEAFLAEFRKTYSISVRRYDVRDLLTGPEGDLWLTTEPNAVPPRPCTQPATQPVCQPATQPQLTPRQARVAALMDVVRNSVARSSWRDSGGYTSSMTEYDGSLYITTSATIHRQLEALFAQMRTPAPKPK